LTAQKHRRAGVKVWAIETLRQKKPDAPFRQFGSFPDVISLVVVIYVRYPFTLRKVQDRLFERCIDICHDAVRLWWNQFGPMFACFRRSNGEKRPKADVQRRLKPDAITTAERLGERLHLAFLVA